MSKDTEFYRHNLSIDNETKKERSQRELTSLRTFLYSVGPFLNEITLIFRSLGVTQLNSNGLAG